MLGVLITQVSECINGVTGPWHSKLYVRSPKLVIIIDSKFYHPKSVLLVCQRFLFFERILRTDYKPNLVQSPSLKKALSDNQMSHMNGIETTEV